PTISPASRCSAARIFRASIGGRCIPASPAVISKYPTSIPRSVHIDTAAEVPYSASSGCATTTKTRVNALSSRGLRAATVPSLDWVIADLVNFHFAQFIPLLAVQQHVAHLRCFLQQLGEIFLRLLEMLGRHMRFTGIILKRFQ